MSVLRGRHGNRIRGVCVGVWVCVCVCLFVFCVYKDAFMCMCVLVCDKYVCLCVEYMCHCTTYYVGYVYYSHSLCNHSIVMHRWRYDERWGTGDHRTVPWWAPG